MKKINDIKNQSIEDEVKTNKPWVIIIALIVLSIFLCGLYFYFITNYTNVEIPRKDIRSLENTITKLEGSIKENKENNQILFDQQIQHTNLIKSLIAKVDNNSNTGPIYPEKIQQIWLLAEIKYLLNLANAQYTLSDNIDLTLLAFELALEKLQKSNLSDLINIRISIEKELDALKEFNNFSPENNLISLEEITKKIELLPFKKQTKDYDNHSINDLSWPEKIMQSINKSIKNIIIVRNTSQIRNDDSYKPANRIISIQLSTLLMEIKLALINSNHKKYQETLQNTIDWIERFYDIEATAVKEVLNELVKKIDYKPLNKKPNISKTLLLIQEHEMMLINNKPNTEKSNK